MCIALDHAGQSEARSQCSALHLDDTARLANDPLGCANIAIWPDRQEITLAQL